MNKQLLKELGTTELEGFCLPHSGLSWKILTERDEVDSFLKELINNDFIEKFAEKWGYVYCEISEDFFEECASLDPNILLTDFWGSLEDAVFPFDYNIFESKSTNSRGFIFIPINTHPDSQTDPYQKGT